LSNFSQCTLDNEAFLGQVQILYDNGARKFWIHGTGALGCLPALVVREKGEHDANGCLAGVNRAAKAYNKKLSQLCDEMRFHLKGATVVYTDMFAIKYDFVANHTKYGMKFCWFRHSEKKKSSSDRRCSVRVGLWYRGCSSGIEWPFMVCCGNGGPPYNFDAGKFGCGDLCPPEAKVVSWDGVHFTDFGSGLAAKLAMSGEYSKPKVKLASLIHGGSKKASDS
jgi:hypothetical protein